MKYSGQHQRQADWCQPQQTTEELHFGWRRQLRSMIPQSEPNQIRYIRTLWQNMLGENCATTKTSRESSREIHVVQLQLLRHSKSAEYRDKLHTMFCISMVVMHARTRGRAAPRGDLFPRKHRRWPVLRPRHAMHCQLSGRARGDWRVNGHDHFRGIQGAAAADVHCVCVCVVMEDEALVRSIASCSPRPGPRAPSSQSSKLNAPHSSNNGEVSSAAASMARSTTATNAVCRRCPPRGATYCQRRAAAGHQQQQSTPRQATTHPPGCAAVPLPTRSAACSAPRPAPPRISAPLGSRKKSAEALVAMGRSGTQLAGDTYPPHPLPTSLDNPPTGQNPRRHTSSKCHDTPRP